MVIDKVMFLQLHRDVTKLFSLTPLSIFLTLICIVIPGSGQGSAHVSKKLNSSYVRVRMLEVGKAISGHFFFLQSKF